MNTYLYNFRVVFYEEIVRSVKLKARKNKRSEDWSF